MSGESRSLWMEESTPPPFPALAGDLDTDVCVIGGGITGVSAAYRLAREGRDVVLLESEEIGSGQTQRTTAHLAWVLDDRFSRLEALHGVDATRLAWQSHAAALRAVEQAVRDEEITCGLEHVDGHLFRDFAQDDALLRAEYDAARRCGVSQVEWLAQPPVATLEGPCVRFAGQLQLQPLAYLAGLARAAVRHGAALFTSTRARAIEGAERLRVRTTRGTVTARWVVVATNAPFHTRFALHTKQTAYRTYAIAVPIAAGSVPHALYWDTLDPYHYVRVQPTADPAVELLIAGGEDHRTGAVTGNDAERRYERLEHWARSRFAAIGPVTHRWSGQVLEPVDGLAFIGETPGRPRVLLATGDSGMGLTHGTIAALLFAGRVAGRTSPWDSLYDPARKTLRAAREWMRENATTAARYASWATLPGSLPALGIGEAAVVRRGLRALAVHRDRNGDTIVRSAVCPHLGGLVAWNAAESTWDCPCHGSRFDRFGRVLEGPANEDLAPAELDDASSPAAEPIAFERGTGRDGGSSMKKEDASSILESIDVEVPVTTAYNQWTQFEEFPAFMEGVESVRQIDDTHLHWKAEVGGKTVEWDAEITEQTPDQRIAWCSLGGARNAGVVTFHRISDTSCRVTLQIDYQPEGVVENVGDLLGVVERRARGDLERFKEFIEERGVETGGWRGEVEQPDRR
jgi:glycine/D-amino acid oxidase-like deaminating enzyme/uncharacterized membrane protein/nitrite reductase/ring-hydroxylating ferredoxin subunit